MHRPSVCIISTNTFIIKKVDDVDSTTDDYQNSCHGSLRQIRTALKDVLHQLTKQKRHKR